MISNLLKVLFLWQSKEKFVPQNMLAKSTLIQ